MADPKRATGCTAFSSRTGRPCGHGAGWGTDHPGIGTCRFHGGNTPQYRTKVARDLAVRAVTKLGIPLGNGDPFVLLEHTVQHAEGYLAAAAAALVESGQSLEPDPDAETERKAPLIADVTIAAELYQDAIKTAARTGKAAVDAKVADRQITVDLAMANLINRFIGELFTRIATLIPKDERPAIEAWAKGRLEELAVEFERGGRLN